MIPSTVGYLATDFTIEEQPSKSYKMDLEGDTIKGYVLNREAVKQAIFKALNVERYKYPIYSWNYGIETMDLYGEPMTYVCPELERRIEEALIVDSRIISVTNFTHDTSVKGTIITTFTANTIYGDVESENEVNV